jgi:Holliday junction resolvase RusA-like endonuclease
MHSFIIKRQPKAYQGSKTFKSTLSKENYIKDLQSSLLEYNPLSNAYDDHNLYGIVYYFFNKNTGTDADNISKPIWDCLKGILFNDDKQIKLRTAGAFDLGSNDFNVIDFSRVKGEIVADLLESFDDDEHVVYIECGILDFSMFKFNLESDGN